ncbi:MAG: HupE/UreJ family protein [Saprospiraceae bacterium]
MFAIYLELGFDHILDLNGYDHIVFLIALCAMYTLKEWRQVLVLVTAFTIGHSITLALSALDIVTVKASLIELLIPITILITALQNLFTKPDNIRRWGPNYLLALSFGFIHGMGFSNYFKALLGKEADIITPLFAFNVGVELGQLCIVAAIMVINLVVVRFAKLKQRNWTIAVSLIAAVLAVYMISQRIFDL